MVPINAVVLARLVAVAALFNYYVQAICYYPNGDVSVHDVPCQDDKEHSTCCGNGWGCLANKLCERGITSGRLNYARGSCTDKNWRSSECPLFCVNPEYDSIDSGADIERCEDNDEHFYCNGTGRARDCDNSASVLRFRGDFSTLTIIGVESSTSTSTSTTPTTTEAKETTTVANESPTETDDVSAGARVESTKEKEVGIGVGVGLGVPLAIAAVALGYLFGRRRRNAQVGLETGRETQGGGATLELYGEREIRYSELQGQDLKHNDPRGTHVSER